MCLEIRRQSPACLAATEAGRQNDSGQSPTPLNE